MQKTIDACGKACPIPVILAKKEIDAGAPSFAIQVDNEIAVQNLRRMAVSQHYQETVTEAGGIYTVSMHKIGSKASLQDVAPALDQSGTMEAPFQSDLGVSAVPARVWALFAGKDTLGTGDEALGNSLIRMFFYTLAQSEDLPRWIVFMNSGVKLPVSDEQVVAHLKVLQDKGCEILVCGTCLNYYEIKDNLQIGTISNMYDITTCLQKAEKVLTL